ncbi:MAG: hypothetical protein E7352_05815 [Clostridiales bacterium]|nr:hypothetical protein [Clostridiales bacterium]
MKKFCIFFLALFILSIVTFGIAGGGFGADKAHNGGGRYTVSGNFALEERDFLRIHIRADSNESHAQAVKYRVRDKVVEYLAPVLAECETKEKAMETMRGCLPQIAAVASDVLQEQGFPYGATATIEREVFPTRVYAEYTLPSGEYTALILRLGRGQGDNWWCVAYPPLCFVNANVDVQYKSKLAEIIRRCKG